VNRAERPLDREQVEQPLDAPPVAEADVVAEVARLGRAQPGLGRGLLAEMRHQLARIDDGPPVGEERRSGGHVGEHPRPGSRIVPIA
jgi:hypothetical protein